MITTKNGEQLLVRLTTRDTQDLRPLEVVIEAIEAEAREQMTYPQAERRGFLRGRDYERKRIEEDDKVDIRKAVLEGKLQERERIRAGVEALAAAAPTRLVFSRDVLALINKGES